MSTKIPIKLPANTCTLSECQQKPLLTWPSRFPLRKMFFVTEELYPFSVTVDKVRDRAVFLGCNRVPFTQCCCGCTAAHRPVRRDRQLKLDRLLTKATGRGDRCFRPDPMHDGNSNRPARSHTVELGLPWNLHTIGTRRRRERVQDNHLLTARIIFEEIDVVEPLNTLCNFFC